MSATLVAVACALVVAQTVDLDPPVPVESGLAATSRGAMMSGETPATGCPSSAGSPRRSRCGTAADPACTSAKSGCAVGREPTAASRTRVMLAHDGFGRRASLTGGELTHLAHDAESPRPFRSWLHGIGRTSALFGAVLVGGTAGGLGAYALHLALRPGQGGVAMLIGFGVQQLASAVALRLIGAVQGRAPGWAAALFCQWMGLVVGAIPLGVVVMLGALIGQPPPAVAVPTLVVAGVLSSWVSVVAYGAAEGRRVSAPVVALRF